MPSIMDLFRQIDKHYNEQNWVAYQAFFAPGFRQYSFGSTVAQTLEQHVRVSQQFCDVFPDNKVEQDPYLVAFSNDEWTCTIARLTGTMTGPFRVSASHVVEPTGRSFETQFVTMTKWSQDKVIEEYAFLDFPGVLRQVGAIT